MLDPLRISALQDAVRANYAAHAKDLPWRTNATPYHVLVSEIMSQQTQIERVVPKYLARMEKFPDIYILAAVSQADVLTMRSGLGFNRRAINLHKCAQTIVDIYDGVIPNDPILLKKLPGLGDYTAHSICAFAYNMDVPVMDINTKRIMLHWFGYDEKTTSDTDVRAMLMACLPRGRASDRYNALMDYGSQVLHARKTGIKSPPQSTFAGSRRQARGNILKYLINHGPTHISIVSDHVIFDDLSGVIDELIGEKMIVCEDGVVRLVG